MRTSDRATVYPSGEAKGYPQLFCAGFDIGAPKVWKPVGNRHLPFAGRMRNIPPGHVSYMMRMREAVPASAGVKALGHERHRGGRNERAKASTRLRWPGRIAIVENKNGESWRFAPLRSSHEDDRNICACMSQACMCSHSGAVAGIRGGMRSRERAAFGLSILHDGLGL